VIVCFSVKGGSGTTVVSAALGVMLAGRSDSGARIVDLAGDLPAAMGMGEPKGPGVSDWLMSQDDAGILEDLLVPANNSLSLIPLGSKELDDLARYESLAKALTNMSVPVVVDAGSGACRSPFVDYADVSYLVIRPCYLALRHAAALKQPPTGIILIFEEGRALNKADVEAVVGAPVIAEIPYESAIARSVDAGLLAGRLPTTLGQRLAVAV